MQEPINNQSMTRSETWHPFGLSLLSHLLLLVMTGWYFYPPPKQEMGDSIRKASVVLIAINDQSETEYLTKQPELTSVESQLPNNASEKIATEILAPSIRTTTKPTLPGAAPVETDTNANQMSTAIPQPQTREFVFSPADLKMIASEKKWAKSQQPAGPTTTLSLFGSGELVGRRFVFVLDRSKSMGSGGLGVIDRAESELAQAIAKLEEHHRFQIVAYNDRASSIGKRSMLVANEGNKKFVPIFIRNLVAYGGTSHENGLTVALSFQPDIVVLLTDGGYPLLNAGQLKTIQVMARRHTQIHAIQFGAGPLQEPDNFMMRLVRQNNGGYRYIDVNKW